MIFIISRASHGYHRAMCCCPVALSSRVARSPGVLGVALLLGFSASGFGSVHVATDDEPPQRGLRGVLAIRGGEVLAEEHADRLFTPASVHKLLVAAAGLHILGGDFSVRTTLYGQFVSGAVGDLTVVGAGDPTWNDIHFEENPRAPLEALARALREAGVERVTGDLVVDASRFPGRAVPIEWPWGDRALGFGAAPTALGVDRNTVKVRVAPSPRLGEPALISGDESVEWVNETRTVTSERHGRGTIEFQMIWGTPTVIVRGEFPQSEAPFRIEVAAPNPLFRAGEALRSALLEAGIEVAGSVRVAHEPAIPGLDALAGWSSPPLADWLEAILADSNNWYAEMLLRLMALEAAGEGRLDLGVDALSSFLTETVGVAEGAFEIDDGSGLSPFNLVSPRAVVEVLRWCATQKWFALFVENLARGDQGTFGRSWGKAPPLAAKTGTLRHTQGLAGLLAPESAEPIFFALFINHRTEGRALLKREIVRELWRWHRSPPAD